ncbi:MAG: hypothetical protein KJ042_06895, partial [Deltaproteobacteria bacterium]|nr:hypothetical protein [Deltaproteobacteria bacterium]
VELIDPSRHLRHTIPTRPDPVDFAAVPGRELAAVLDTRTHELAIVNIGEQRVREFIPVGQTSNAIYVTPTERYLLTVFDPGRGEAAYDETGVVNPNEITIVDIETGEARFVSLKFSPDRIQCAALADVCLLGREQRMAHLDLATGETVSYPLSLGIDDLRTPDLVRLSPDGAYALVSVGESDDLYVLDLAERNINIMETGSRARSILFLGGDVAVITSGYDASLFVYDVKSGANFVADLGGQVYPSAFATPDGERLVLYDSSYGHSVAVIAIADLVALLDQFVAGESVDLPESIFREYLLDGFIDGEISGRPVRCDPTSRFLAVASTMSNGASYQQIEIVDLVAGETSSDVTAGLGLESYLTDFAFSTTSPTMGLLLGPVGKFVVVDLTTLQAAARPVGSMGETVHYLAGSEAYVVKHELLNGKLAFVGDVDAEFFWMAMSIFNP